MENLLLRHESGTFMVLKVKKIHFFDRKGDVIGHLKKSRVGYGFLDEARFVSQKVKKEINDQLVERSHK